MDQQTRDAVLDAASELVTNDGFDAATVGRISARADVDEEIVRAEFRTDDELFASMFNRERGLVWAIAQDNVDRDPRGGLLSRIYPYTLAGVYERPLARALYLLDRDGLNRILRGSYSFAFVPRFGVSATFIEHMKRVGMVRSEVEPAHLSALLSAMSAGSALTAPDGELDAVNEGLRYLLERAVDADVDDTSPGKIAFAEYALSLRHSDAPDQSDGSPTTRGE